MGWRARSRPWWAPLFYVALAVGVLQWLLAPGYVLSRLNLILAGGVAVLALDMDHLGYVMGLPMLGRRSHSLGFLMLVGAGMWALARSGFLGREAPPLVTGAVAAASVMAHVAWDVMGSGSRGPLWAPFSFTGLAFPSTMGTVFLSGATSLVWAASFLQGRSKREP